MSQAEKYNIAEELFFKKFDTWIPILMGIPEDYYYTDEFIEKIYKAIELNDKSLVEIDYPHDDVLY